MDLSTTFNIQDINSNHTSIAKVLLIFYVLVASNCTDNLMAKQIREYINENRMAQHIIGFLLMIILVTIIGGVVDTTSAIFYALIGYVWFIFSTKLDIHWNIVIISLLFVGYMYENSMSVKKAEVLSDQSLNQEQKLKIIQEQNNFKTWIVCSVLLVTIVGTLLYSYRKHEQYGGNYDVMTYIFN